MLPAYLHKYFWDVDAKKIDKNKSKDYIIARILEYGNIAALKWLFANFSQTYIRQVFSKKRGFSSRVANFWRLFFSLPKNKVVCLKRRCRKNQKNLWPY